MVESIQEVVWEIENQPKENLLPKEVEEQFSHLMVRKTIYVLPLDLTPWNENTCNPQNISHKVQNRSGSTSIFEVSVDLNDCGSS